MIKFRNLTANEIECRVKSIKENYLVLLLYKDARCDMNILDETVGPENWTRYPFDVKGSLYCEVAIRVEREDGFEWVGKSDCGVESNMEAVKGESSDAFKRACFNWGIGRELYTAPFIKIPSDKYNIKNGKCYDNFSVEKIVIKDKTITAISIINETKKTRVFVWQKESKDERN